MSDYFEVDFLSVESDKSGDAIPIRYSVDGVTYIHVVDGGFQATGESVVKHINDHYGAPTRLDHVVVTHPDGDHAGGLRTVLDRFEVGTLWMLRPWAFAEEIIDRFETYNSVDALKAKLKKIYPNLAALEEIALAKGIPIASPFQGSRIGAFSVLAPSKGRYLDLVVESDRTPESVDEAATGSKSFVGGLLELAKSLAALVRSAWGDEIFSPNATSNENEMSVVQYALLAGQKVLLTGDAGRQALAEAADYAPIVGLQLPGIDRFQVPHHGSRRNVSTELLDRWLGERLPDKEQAATHRFTALISSAKADTHHPRKSVVRAMIHRGGRAFATEGVSLCSSHNSPGRAGWSSATPADYSDDQEE